MGSLKTGLRNTALGNLVNLDCAGLEGSHQIDISERVKLKYSNLDSLDCTHYPVVSGQVFCDLLQVRNGGPGLLALCTHS